MTLLTSYRIIFLLPLLIPPECAHGQQQQQFDGATCRLLCVSCERSRQVYAQFCANNVTNATLGVGDAANDCPCLKPPTGANLTAAACPEPQPPPPPPGCPPGGSVRCDLLGAGGRCYGNCVCLTTPGNTPNTPTPPPNDPDCPIDPCPASNCRAYAPADRSRPSCRRLCSDCAANPWWCFSEPPGDCGNSTEVCGVGGAFRRDQEGCQVDCSCADEAEGASSSNRAGRQKIVSSSSSSLTSWSSSSSLSSSSSSTSSCRLPIWLRASCKRICRRKYGGDGRLQVDERKCELCRCCEPCETDNRAYRYKLSGSTSSNCDSSDELGADGCPKCQCD